MVISSNGSANGAYFQQNTCSGSPPKVKGLRLSILLVWALVIGLFVTQGAYAFPANHSHLAATCLDFSRPESLIFPSLFRKRAEVELLDMGKTYDLYRDYLIGKLSAKFHGQKVFEDTLSTEMFDAICRALAYAGTFEKFVIPVTMACEGILDSIILLTAPELSLLDQFGTNFLCSYLAAETLNHIPYVNKVSDLLCTGFGPCSQDLSHDPLNCGACGVRV